MGGQRGVVGEVSGTVGISKVRNFLELDWRVCAWQILVRI